MKYFLKIIGTLLLGMSIFTTNSMLVTFAAPVKQATDSQTFNKIKQRGYIVAGVKFDAPPFGSINKAGEPEGIEIELVREFARRWLGDPAAVEFVQVTSRNRISRLLSGDIDLIAATMTITPERDKEIDFSDSYYEDGQNILVVADSGLKRSTDMDSIQALDGKTIAVIRGSTSINGIDVYTKTQKIKLKKVEFDQYDQAIQPLLENRVDALTTDHGILVGIQQRYAGLEILLDQNFTVEPYGLGLPPGDVAFAALVNQTLQEIRQDQTTYDHVFSPVTSSTATPTAVLPITPTTAVVSPTVISVTLSTATATATTLALAPTPTKTVIATATATPTAVVAPATVTPMALLTAITPTIPSALLTLTESSTASLDTTPVDLPHTGISFYSYEGIPGTILSVVLVLCLLSLPTWRRKK